LWVLCVAR